MPRGRGRNQGGGQQGQGGGGQITVDWVIGKLIQQAGVPLQPADETYWVLPITAFIRQGNKPMAGARVVLYAGGDPVYHPFQEPERVTDGQGQAYFLLVVATEFSVAHLGLSVTTGNRTLRFTKLWERPRLIPHLTFEQLPDESDHAVVRVISREGPSDTDALLPCELVVRSYNTATRLSAASSEQPEWKTGSQITMPTNGDCLLYIAHAPGQRVPGSNAAVSATGATKQHTVYISGLLVAPDAPDGPKPVARPN